MGKNRYLNTTFWDDNYIAELNPKEKLLFLYLLTNTRTNIAGMYEINCRKMIFDTGLTKQDILKALKGFERNRKAFFINETFIVIANFIKHQKLNRNIQTGILNCINNLPEFVKSFLNIDIVKPFKGFQEATKALNYLNLNLNLNSNINSNVNSNVVPTKKQPIPPKDPEEFHSYFTEQVKKRMDMLELKYVINKATVKNESLSCFDNFNNRDWYDSKKKPVLDWKGRVRTWIGGSFKKPTYYKDWDSNASSTRDKKILTAEGGYRC